MPSVLTTESPVSGLSLLSDSPCLTSTVVRPKLIWLVRLLDNALTPETTNPRYRTRLRSVQLFPDAAGGNRRRLILHPAKIHLGVRRHALVDAAERPVPHIGIGAVGMGPTYSFE